MTVTGDHGHGHGHGERAHTHGAAAARSGTRHKSRLLIAFVLSLTVLVVEAVAGFLTNSLALLSDAGHMLTDVSASAWRWPRSSWPPRAARRAGRHTFGLYRLEILAALANAVLLFGVAGWVLVEAVAGWRPPDVQTLAGARRRGLGLTANLVAFSLLTARAPRSAQRQGAYLEVLADLSAPSA